MLNRYLLMLGALALLARGMAAPAAIVDKCKADLARRCQVKAQQVQVLDTRAVTWPNSALGIPEPGKMYLQALTPGWKLVLEARREQYLYTASAKAWKYGGPVALWSAAHLMLHIPNAKIVETVRAYYDGWYNEVMTEPVPISDGMIGLPGKPGLGAALREEVLKRPDVHMEFSDEQHRIDMSKG